MVSRGERPPARASARLLRGREALSISARFLHGRRRSRAESRPPRGVGAHPAQPACATPARTCAPRARRSRSPPPASQWLALLCLPILRLSLWLSSPPPSWDELQKEVKSSQNLPRLRPPGPAPSEDPAAFLPPRVDPCGPFPEDGGLARSPRAPALGVCAEVENFTAPGRSQTVDPCPVLYSKRPARRDCWVRPALGQSPLSRFLAPDTGAPRLSCPRLLTTHRGPGAAKTRFFKSEFLVEETPTQPRRRHRPAVRVLPRAPGRRKLPGRRRLAAELLALEPESPRTQVDARAWARVSTQKGPTWRTNNWALRENSNKPNQSQALDVVCDAPLRNFVPEVFACALAPRLSSPFRIVFVYHVERF
ncbi:uncharacterized protein LOC116661091 [Camelus ferus]|uniref:Uncharacterized protein LOC116661091 n=1 Tax=Camelus ferus TaxID=419612 RepID=A0A8B8SEE9_CAMFR|nr:uncharacterized protein LOC116661091 [Camelus ferus]